MDITETCIHIKTLGFSQQKKKEKTLGINNLMLQKHVCLLYTSLSRV